MLTVPTTPLDEWTARRIGVDRLTRSAIERWQLEQLRDVIAWARERSPLYRRLYGHLPGEALSDLRGLSDLPFVRAERPARSRRRPGVRVPGRHLPGGHGSDIRQHGNAEARVVYGRRSGTHRRSFPPRHEGAGAGRGARAGTDARHDARKRRVSPSRGTGS